jgi:hypothetical protein
VESFATLTDRDRPPRGETHRRSTYQHAKHHTPQPDKQMHDQKRYRDLKPHAHRLRLGGHSFRKKSGRSPNVLYLFTFVNRLFQKNCPLLQAGKTARRRRLCPVRKVPSHNADKQEALLPRETHQRVSFLYLIRLGIIESIPRRRFLSSS